MTDGLDVIITGDLEVGVTVTRGGFTLTVDLRFAPGVTAVVGPNGAGKSTLLRAVAGLDPPVSGHVALAGRTLLDSDRGVDLPVAARRCGVVFQSHLLLPHLTAWRNVAFALRARGRPRAASEVSARSWLDRLGLADVADHLPHQLSGGQAQRVALARALASEPAALLLDEPLASLDVATRHDVRVALRDHLADFPGPVVLVTHDPVEAATLAHRLVVLEDGRVTHDGDVAHITQHPRTPWAARLAGVNLHAGTGRGTTVVLDGGGELEVADPCDGPVWVTVPPTAVALYREHPGGSPRNVWPTRVHTWESAGSRVRVRLDGRPDTVAEVTAAGAAALDLAAGGTVWASVKATEVTTYPR